MACKGGGLSQVKGKAELIVTAHIGLEETMYILSEPEIVKTQERIQIACQRDLFRFFETAEELFSAVLASQELPSLPETQHQELREHTTQQIEHYKGWIKEVLGKAIIISKMDAEGAYEENPPDPITIPLHVGQRVIKDVLKILSCGSDLSDPGLMYAGDVSNALSVAPSLVDTYIEEIQNEKRKDFTQMLLDSLNEDQCYWIAAMLWMAVHVDGETHPQEYKYFENIAHLLQYDQVKLKQLEKEHKEMTDIPKQPFVSKLSAHIYRYIVEIVMIDGQYVDAEAKFIQEIGTLFGYDKAQQDQIIQPVASALMLRRSLFMY